MINLKEFDENGHFKDLMYKNNYLRSSCKFSIDKRCSWSVAGDLLFSVTRHSSSSSLYTVVSLASQSASQSLAEVSNVIWFVISGSWWGCADCAGLIRVTTIRDDDGGRDGYYYWFVAVDGCAHGEIDWSAEVMCPVFHWFIEFCFYVVALISRYI